jgi:hypothetical protein
MPTLKPRPGIGATSLRKEARGRSRVNLMNCQAAEQSGFTDGFESGVKGLGKFFLIIARCH